MERKGSTIERIRTASFEVQMIGLADKLSNMRDIDRDYPVVGEDLWNRFRMKDKKTIGWYYRGIQEALRERFARVPAYEEYCHLVDRHFAELTENVIDQKKQQVKKWYDAQAGHSLPHLLFSFLNMLCYCAAGRNAIFLKAAVRTSL